MSGQRRTGVPRWTLACLLAFCAGAASQAVAEQVVAQEALSQDAVVQQAVAEQAPTPPAAAIASAHPQATEAGFELLAAGGNAFDAAVAVAAALAVVEPFSSGIGGGGFFLVHRAADGFETMVDARERAPGAATRDMYLDAAGEVVAARSRDGALAAAIPGLPAGLVHLATRFGRRPLAESLAPAIRLAAEGYNVSAHYARMAEFRSATLGASPESARIFLGPDGRPTPGWRLVQPELADTLRALADEGMSGFYAGEVARRLVEGVRAAGGIWTLGDLADYRVVEREPVRGTWRGIRVTSAPLPSSGGIVLLEALGILGRFDLAGLPPVDRIHLGVEALRRAYRDRAAHLGDPDFVQAPVARLLDPAHAARLAAGIDAARATPSQTLPPLGAAVDEYPNTTHLSVLDTEGNRVAATLSINLPFGSGFTPPGTGVLLNDEMDDFAAKPMTPNAYGLVGVDANAIAPGKRPLSSMTPTFLDDGRRVAVLGTPGGSRIISMVMIGVLAFADGLPPAAWVATPRWHHQYLPDVIQHEPGAFDEATAGALIARGHALKDAGRRYGNMQAIAWDRASGRVEAASDPRGEGLAAVRIPDTSPTASAAERLRWSAGDSKLPAQAPRRAARAAASSSR